MMEPVIEDLILPCVVLWFSFFYFFFFLIPSFAIAPEYEIASVSPAGDCGHTLTTLGISADSSVASPLIFSSLMGTL